MTAAPAVTRFAPSPSGLLHLGHAYAALFAARRADDGGRFLLRIEDIDIARCRPEFEAAILEDLAWLGLAWEQPVWRQSTRLECYRAALDRLDTAGLLYPCFCTRREIRAEIERATHAPHGPEGALYPGTCRALSAGERAARIAAGESHALRLDMARAIEQAGPLTWMEHGHLGGGSDAPITADPGSLGDIVLGRKETAGSYHLTVVVDDAAQGVTLVTRGEDLFHATHVHRLLQALLDLPVPEWHHHRMLEDESGTRLAKRHDALALRALREAGRSPAEVRAMAGFPD